MSSNYGTALSHIILAGTGVYCYLAVKDSPYFFSQCSFGVIVANSLIGLWRWGNPSYGQDADSLYRLTSFLQDVVALPFIACETWLNYGFAREIALADALLSLSPLVLYLGKNDSRNLIDTVIASNAAIIGVLSFIHQNYFEIGDGAPLRGSLPSKFFGKAITSRMLTVFSMIDSSLSSPRAMPPCGGQPQASISSMWCRLLLSMSNMSKMNSCMDGSISSQSKIAVTDDGSTIVAWHPKDDFPYECTRPLPEPVVVESTSVLKTNMTPELMSVFNKKTPEQARQELMDITFTTKHRWFPRARDKKAKKTPMDRENVLFLLIKNISWAWHPIFKFCRSKCHAAFKKKKNPRKVKWTKAYRKTVGKELAIDPSFEFEKRRNVPVKYDREMWSKAVEAMKKVESIKQKRQGTYIMQRLRKGRELEQERDIKEVQRDLSLIRSPAVGLKERKQAEAMAEDARDSEDEKEEMEGVVEYDMENSAYAATSAHLNSPALVVFSQAASGLQDVLRIQRPFNHQMHQHSGSSSGGGTGGSIFSPGDERLMGPSPRTDSCSPGSASLSPQSQTAVKEESLDAQLSEDGGEGGGYRQGEAEGSGSPTPPTPEEHHRAFRYYLEEKHYQQAENYQKKLLLRSRSIYF
nr:unnamed protein product [Callosobruchus chinensis]